ncbi:flagellar assembly lytic transglycosylase [Spirochaeta dissipatitropha]
MSISCFILLSCSSSQPEGYGLFIPGDYFADADFSDELSLYEGVLEYSPGAAFTAGRYLEIHMQDTQSAKGFFLLSLAHDPPPFNSESALRLLEIADSLDDAETAYRIAEKIEESDISGPEVDRALASFYYSGDYDNYLLPVLERIDELYGMRRRDPEVLMWEIVYDLRNSEREFPHEAIQSLNTWFRAHDVHWRLERYIQFRPELAEQMQPGNLRLLQLKAAVSQQQFRGNIREFFGIAEEQMTEALLWDIYTAALQGNDRHGAAALFQDFARSSKSEAFEITALELSGRILALSGLHRAAQEAFLLGLSAIDSSDSHALSSLQGQRIAWNWWRSGIRIGADTALVQSEQLSDWIHNLHYFNDIMHDFISQLIREQRWNALQDLYISLDGSLSTPVEARLVWVLAELQRLGLLDSSVLNRRKLLQTAAEQNEDPYYRLVAEIALQQRPELPLLAITPQIPDRGQDYDESVYLQWTEQMYRAGLLDDGYRLKHRYAVLFSFERLSDYVELHFQAGRYIDGMRLVDRWLRVNQSELPPELGEDFMLLRYPMAFEEEMLEVIERHELQPALFYGLVREESFFDAGIRSHVGATGLAQLMPATAQDMIQLLRLQNPDLTDPRTNLSIGSFYFRRLLNRFEQYVQALVAYNAGQGRVNTWRLEPWARSSILFHEGLPFEETRHYIRKITVTAVHYQQLYFSGTAEEVFFQIFPDFDPYTDG